MRSAIAMIELIFALVIMGIALMSAPMLISTATKSTSVALQQEAIATTASEIGMILTRHWDEEDTNTLNTVPILRSFGDTELNASIRRAGTPSSSTRTFSHSMGVGKHPSLATLKINFTKDGDNDDIDDFDGIQHKLTSAEDTETENGDIVDTNIILTTQVNYISDEANYNNSGSKTLKFENPFNNPAPNATSNIKFIKVTLTTRSPEIELEKNITLNAFSCNIGGYALHERTFQ